MPIAGGAGGRGDGLGRVAVLQLDDLPGDGWQVGDEVDDAAGDEADDAGFESALVGLPEGNVAASASSSRFSRGDALAWSTTWLLTAPAPAAAAFQRLGEPAFAEAFVGSVAASLGGPDHAGPQVLGTTVDPPVPVEGVQRAVLHRGRVVAGVPAGTLVVHLDLVALHAGDVVALLVLGDSPQPPADDLVSTVASRLASRLG